MTSQELEKRIFFSLAMGEHEVKKKVRFEAKRPFFPQLFK